MTCPRRKRFRSKYPGQIAALILEAEKEGCLPPDI